MELLDRQENVTRPSLCVCYKARSNTSLSLRLVVSFLKEIWTLSGLYQLRGKKYVFVKNFSVLQQITMNYWYVARFKTDAF